MNINPMQMIGMLMNKNPLFRQAQNMAKGKTPEELKQVCQNVCNQRGIDFDTAWSQFQSQMPMSGLK